MEVKFSLIRLRDTPRTMSEESTTPDLAELVRRTFEAFSGGDLDAVTSVFASDAEWRSVGLGTSFRGTPAIRSFLADWRGRYEDYEIELAEVRDLGNGVVLIKSRQSGSQIQTASTCWPNAPG